MNDVWQPHVVVACVVERDGKFLLVEERIGGELRFNQPAGHWEPGETLIEGAIRETREESGWEVEPTDFLGVYEWQASTLPYPFVRFAFVARAIRHFPEQPLDTGIERAVWMSRDEIAERPSLLRSPSVLNGIDDYERGIRYPLSVIQHLKEPAP